VFFLTPPAGTWQPIANAVAKAMDRYGAAAFF
jgi:hypothetical protein